ncbi:nitrile hydratase subunit alpha [Mesorhizobium sp. CO1-1-8]|uniref:nitrile hydratase subunit alpha n=1 Tax=Mesorhizobium sp. CO1-1-8 TaxID=2876631 RepID=UPI001CD0AFCD|nr:nitrile hydratase subunit alpha [Mesorhizobium sp. CO1-1-8]MBZ9772390.1 nitrile hydratase subunit alpha [Mesorhizobium sp. CO1-1-8]
MTDPHHNMPVADAEVRARALREALEDKGLISAEFIEKWKDTFDGWVPENGAKIVAKAWTDPDYKERLLNDAASAAGELGFGGVEGGFITALENTKDLQNVIVCSLCSCTAWPILGLPPEWYKSFEYRSRIVREPRQVLSELGFDVPQEIKIRVWDTTAETRYMVLPLRPEGTEDWTAERLERIVTKETLIGTANPDPNSAIVS